MADGHITPSQSLWQDIKDEFSKENFLLGNCDPKKMYKMQFADAALPLLIFRLLSAIFFITILIVNSAQRENPGFQFLFFTVWTFTLLALYFAISTIISIIHYHKDRQTNTGRIEPSGEQGETNPGYDSYQTEKRENESTAEKAEASTESNNTLPWYMKVQWIIYNIVITAAILVTLVYWAVLYPLRVIYEGFQTDFFDVALHVFNTVLIMVDQYLGAVPTRLTHVLHPVVYGVVYAIFSLIPFFTNDIVLYPIVLDWNNPGVTVASICGIILFCCISQLVLFLIYRQKCKCTKQL